jgi:4-hydroxyacetophenone monooxygenase
MTVSGVAIDGQNDARQPRWRPSLPLESSEALEGALAAADLPTLLMAYTHLSHDEALLESFRPHIHAIGSGKQTDIPASLAAELRDKMKTLLVTPGAAQGEPSPDLLQKIMSVGMGEHVGSEFVPLLLEQTGLGSQPDRAKRSARDAIPADFKVLVIGAGLTGMAAAIKLAEAGYDYEVIDKNPEVGGTWYANRYPGVGVDTPSYFYSYSFELNPYWTTFSPKGPEMQDYLVRVSHKYAIRDNIRFSTTVTSLRWNESENLWTVHTRGADGAEDVVRANVVINAHGPLDRWEWPKIPGLETFTGPLMHTAAWDSSVDLKGKRVALIGTGASGAQVGPAIAADVDKLTVFMRSRHWVLPNPTAGGVPVPEAMRWAMRHIPFYLEYFRFYVYWTGSDGLWSNLVVDPEWADNPLAISAQNEGLRQYCLANLNAKLASRPDLIEKLTPDSPCFSKRIIMDAGWYDMFLRDNVALEEQPIEQVLPNGIRMADGTVHEVDIIAAATGFNIQRMTGNLEIIGRDGRNLGEEWGDEDANGYFGVTVPGYPNYFHMNGPNSGPNHGAGLNLVAEAQVHYVIECLDALVQNGAAAMEPTEQARGDFNDAVQAQMLQMIWTHPKAKNYYKNSKGRVIVSWPFRLLDYWTQSRKPDVEHYHFLGAQADAPEVEEAF